MTISERMLNYRAENRLSLQDFADKCGISRQTAWSVERGQQTPSRLTVAKIELVIGKELVADEDKRI